MCLPENGNENKSIRQLAGLRLLQALYMDTAREL